MAIAFKYAQFFDYYTSEHNVVSLQRPMNIWYYNQTDKYNGIWTLESSLSTSMIRMCEKDVFITSKNGWLFFNVPRLVNSKYLGDHLSIGFKSNRKIIDMHFTIQNELIGKAEHDSKKKCFIKDGMDISDVSNLQCQQPNGGKLHEHFTNDEIIFIKELLQTPFLHKNIYGGITRNKEKYKYKGKKYLIRFGNRGGKYILVEKRKIYIH